MKRFLPGVLAVLAVAAIVLGSIALQRLHDVPSMDVHATPLRSSDPTGGDTQPSGFTVTFLGVSTLLFDDGETAFMTDGFFSRPSLGQVAVPELTPDLAEIQRALDRVGVEQLAAVIPLHTHYDHAMDSATVADLTGADMVGSESAAYLARGHGLPEERIRVVADGGQVQLGAFTLHFIESQHAPGDRMPGIIDYPLQMPAHATQFRTGTVYSLLVEHRGRQVLVHASAGYVEGRLANHQADVVYLGIGDLGAQGEHYIQDYWEHVVKAVGARRVVVIHWDNFFRPLAEPLEPMPRLFQELRPAMEALYRAKLPDGIELRLPVVFDPVDPFADLPEHEGDTGDSHDAGAPAPQWRWSGPTRTPGSAQ